MRGQVFTIAKFHYINGVVYFAAGQERTDIITLADHYVDTTKSGDVKHPVERVRMLARFAKGLGLIAIKDKGTVTITNLGKEYYTARASEKWSLSDNQKKLMRDHILSDPSRTATIHAVYSLLDLVRKGHSGDDLTHQYAVAINKEFAWNSEVTYTGFTQFGLNYLEELGFIKSSSSLEKPQVNKEAINKSSTKVNTILFTWNPNKYKWQDLPQAIYEANAEGVHQRSWSCGVTKNIEPGDRAFLIRLGVPNRGIVGSGVILSVPYKAPHWDAEQAVKGKEVNRVDIAFDVISEAPILDEYFLSTGDFSKFDWYQQSSGVHVPEAFVQILEDAWSKVTGTQFKPHKPDVSSTIYTEGNKNSRLIKQYERNPDARQKCINHYGLSCRVCGMGFTERYGKVGNGFIHVHHLALISEKGEEHKVDAIQDLRPVCPNCHAMLHKKVPPYTIEELKSKLS